MAESSPITTDPYSDDLYESHVNAWGRRVADSLGVESTDEHKFTIEARRGYGGGCDTCGFGGDEGGFELYRYPGGS